MWPSDPPHPQGLPTWPLHTLKRFLLILVFLSDPFIGFLLHKGKKPWHVRLEFPGIVKIVILHQTHCILLEHVLSPQTKNKRIKTQIIENRGSVYYKKLWKKYIAQCLCQL